MIVHDGSMLIKDEIKLKVRSKIKAIENETDAKIDEMNADTDLRMKKMRDDIFLDAGKRADAERKKIDAQTNVEINRMILDAKEEVISDVVSVAMNEIEGKSPKKLRKELVGLLMRGVAECSAEKLVILGNRETLALFDLKCLDAVKKNTSCNILFEKKIMNMSSGIVLEDTANDMFLDYSFESMFKSREDEIRSNVSQILFD